VFGQITEGEDVIQPNITSAITYQDVSAAGGQTNLPIIPFMDHTDYWSNPSSNTTERTVYGLLILTLPDYPIANDWYYVTIACPSKGITSRTASYEVKAGDVGLDLKNGLIASMTTNGFVLQTTAVPNQILMYPENAQYGCEPKWVAGDVNTVYSGFTYSAYYLRYGFANKYPDLKCGSSHSFGIVYKDRSGRQCSVMPFDAVYIPFYTEPNGASILLSSIVNLTFSISHQPPSWAKTYEIVYFGNNSMDYFMQIRESGVWHLNYGVDRYSLDVNDTFAWTYLQNNRWQTGAYVWQLGDRIRLIGTINAGTGVITKYSILYDYEVEGTSTEDGSVTTGDYLIFQAKSHPHDLDLGTTAITNLTGDLSGTVVHTTPNDPATPTARVDTLTLTGTTGTATICCGTYEATVTWDASGLAQTAKNFATTAGNISALSALGIDLTYSGNSIIFTAHVAGVDFPSPMNVIVELYRPKKGLGQVIAYGCGMVFDIATDSNGNLYHTGNVNQVFNAAGVLVTPAQVYNTANDCWKFSRLNYSFAGGVNTGSVQPFWAESIFPSDWWVGQVIDNKLTSCGFPFIYDLTLKQVQLDERIRNGGFLLTGTTTNNIAHFVDVDFRDLPEKDGIITGLREVGYVLKVIQEHKETSIYVNRVQTFNPDGTSQFTLTDAFLGVMRPMDDNYGCQHPDSIVANNRNLYYYDCNEGMLIRSDPNGQKVLSGPEYRMSRWFKDLLIWIRSSGGASILQVRIGINNEHEEVWITFNMNGNVKGIIFSEATGRFVSEIDQITESYVHLGNFFAHLYHQTLWVMNSDEGQDYLSWSGIPTDAELEVVSNIEPQKNKVFNAVGLFTDHLLESLDEYVYIPQQVAESHQLMQTNIPVFEQREGVYFGQIMKDINTPGVFSSVFDAKLNGRDMRGRYCYLKFHTEEHTDKVRIDSVVIFSTPSERNV